MSFSPSYQDYLQFGNFGGSENAGTPGSQEWWNSLTPEQQFTMIGGNLYLHPGDSRYSQFSDVTKPQAGRDILLFGPQNTDFRNQFVDQNRVYHNNGVTATAVDNQTPFAQNNADRSIGPFLLGSLLMIAGGAAAGAFGGEAGAAAGDSMGAAAGQGFGTAGGSAAGSTGAVGAAGADVNPGLLSNIEEPTFNSMNLSGLDDAMSGLGLNAGDVSPGLLGNVGDVNPGLLQNIPEPTFNSMNLSGLNSVMSGLNPSLASQVGDWISKPSNLLRVAGAAQSLYGLVGSNGGHSSGGNSNNGSNGSSGSKGGNGNGINGGANGSVNRQFYVNPITQQQLQHFSYAQPRALGGR